MTILNNDILKVGIIGCGLIGNKRAEINRDSAPITLILRKMLNGETQAPFRQSPAADLDGNQGEMSMPYLSFAFLLGNSGITELYSPGIILPRNYSTLNCC